MGCRERRLKRVKPKALLFFQLWSLRLPDDSMDGGLRPVVLSHYPLLRWDRMHYGSFMLHGHVHGTLPFDPNVKRYDVGVDSNNFEPISFEEIKLLFSAND